MKLKQTSERVHLEQRESQELCAYCREPASEDTPRCAGCAVRLHAPCWGELGACPTLGCEVPPPPTHALAGPLSAPLSGTPLSDAESRFRSTPMGRLGLLAQSVAKVPVIGPLLTLVALVLFLSLPFMASAFMSEGRIGAALGAFLVFALLFALSKRL